MPSHTVSSGDCFNSIAKENGFYNYLTVYKHGENSSNWKNPNMLEPGGVVDVPAKKTSKRPLKLDQENKFLVDRRKTRLRLVLVDADLKPLKVAKCETTVGGKSSARPRANGQLDFYIDPAKKTGMVSIELERKAGAGSGAKAATQPNEDAYPPSIREAEYKDAVAKAADFRNVQWDLKIGYLEPPETTRGVLQRLVNLGFVCPIGDVEDDQTSAAVKAYQRYFKLTQKDQETGSAADIQGDIEQRHDHL